MFIAEKEMFTDTSSWDIEQMGLITNSVNPDYPAPKGAV